MIWALISHCFQEFNPQPLFRPRVVDSRHMEKALFDIGAESSKVKIGLQLLIIILPDMAGSYG